MEQTHTFSVDFLVRKSKTDKSKTFIYARIALDGGSKEISIQEEIKTKDWDTKTETVKGRSPEAQSINDHIEDVRVKIKQRYRELKTQNVLLTAKTFPRISNKDVNENLKIIQEICNIPFSLTFHIARHNFAKAVALKNGIPLETVQMMMGHTKITTTQIYADVDEEKILEDTKDLNEKLDRKRARVMEHQAIVGLN